LFDNPPDPTVLIRTKELYDGAEPSGNSVAALDLLRLSWLLDRPEWRERAARIVAAAAPVPGAAPPAVPQMPHTPAFLLGDAPRVVIGGAPDGRETARLLEAVRSRFMPRRVVLLADGGAGQARLARRLHFLEGMRPPGGAAAAAHVC